MGNAALMCAPSIISNGGGGGVVRVVSTTDGRLLIYTTKSSPPKAAEILIRNPGEFLCESTHLRVGQRIPGVCADEELEIGQLYFLLPMEMLYSVLTDDEMNSIVNTHKTSTKLGFKQQAVIFSKKNITSITFPHDFFCLFPNNNNNNNNLEDESANGERFTRQRSWEPALETIHE